MTFVFFRSQPCITKLVIQKNQKIKKSKKNKEVSYKFPVQKVDVIRLLILHHWGGMYVDMDYECCRNFEKYLIDHPSPIYIVGSPLSV